MADLYFKINADYEELIRMQREATRLKQTLSDFSGSKEEFEELNNQLNKLSASIAKTSEQAAKDFQKAFSLKDVDFSMDFAKGIEGFDKDILAFTSNLQKYFRDSQSECESTLRVVQELSERLSNVQITPENAEQVKAAHTQLYELSEELQKQQAILSQNQAAWEDVTNAVKNGTTASMENVRSADELYRVSNASKETSDAQVQSLEQVIAAEEMEAQVLEANRQEVDKLGQQALNTITQLKDMSNVFTSMGISDSGFTEQVQKLEDAALNLAGTSNVEVAQQVANEVKAVFEKALDELKQAKESIPDFEAIQIQENDAEYRAAIDKQKEEIATIQAKRDEQRAEFEERQQQISNELEMLERRRNAYQQTLDIAGAQEEIPVSVSNDEIEHLQAVKENLAECNSEIASLRGELSQLEQSENAEASKAQQDIAERTSLIDGYKQQLSELALHELNQAEKQEAAAQKDAELAAQKQAEMEAQRAEAERQDGITLKQIADMQELIDKERERVDVLKQQAEEAQKVAEQKVGEAKPSVLDVVNPFAMGKLDAANAAVDDANAKTAEYEDAKESLKSYEEELDGLVQKLSDAGFAQYEEAEALRVAKEQSEQVSKSFREQGQANRYATGELEATTEAAKRLRFENLKQQITEGNAKLEELAQKLVQAKAAAEQADINLKNASDALKTGDDAKLVDNFERAQEASEKANNALQETAAEYNLVKQGQDELNKAISEGSEHHVRMRTQIMNAREEMMQLIAAGKQGTPEFQKLATEAGAMRRQMNLANATMQYFANPNKNLATLKTTLQGVAGAAGMVTGVMGLFNTKSEDMAKIQTKIQSVMAVIVGLETTYNLVKKSSNTMIAIQQVKTWALALAKKGEAVATAEATVAQEGLNAAMAASPIGAITALVMAAAAAIWALWNALSSETEAEKEHKKVQEQLGEIQQEVARKTADAYSSNLKAYEDLRESYNKTAKDVKAKSEWWNAHKSDLQKLGLEVDNVTGLYDVFVGQTDRVKDALMQRAKYAALCAVKTQLMADAVAAALGAGKDAAKVNDKVSAGEWDKALAWYEKQGNDVSRYKRSGLLDRKMVLNTASSAQIYNMYKGQQEEARLNKVLDNLNKQIEDAEKEAKISISNNARVTMDEVQTAKTTGRSTRGGGSTKSTYNEQDAANRRKELLEEYGKKVIAVSEKVENDITDATLEFMGDGIDKQVAKIREGTLRQLDALEDEKKQLIEAYRKLQLDLYMTQKGAKKYDAKYNEILNTSDEDIWKQVSKTKVNNARSLAEAQREERRILEAAGRENIIDELEFKFGIGNVEVASRPIVEAKKMLEAGYKEFKDSQDYATVFSMGNAFTDKEGMEREILYTPILPDGSVLSEKELNEYISNVVASGSSTEEILAADTKKLIIKVDAQVEDGEKLHQLQEQLYDGQQEAISKVYNERLTLNADFNTRQQQIIMAGAKAEFEIINKAQLDAIKSYEGYYDKQLAIQRKYNETRTKLEEQRRKGLINDSAYSVLKESIDEREQAELNRLDLDRFKTTPMYQIAMSGDVVDSDALQKVYDEMQRQMDEAAATMQPADFKAFMDAFTNISDQMIAKNPFGALKDAAEELRYAELDLIMAHKDTLGAYKDYDLDEFGNAMQYNENGEEGRMWKLEQADIDAQRELTDAQNAYNEALKGNSAEEVANAQKRLTDAEQNAQTTALQLTAAKNAVTNAEQREGNALTRVQSLKKKEQKATKEAVKLTKQWASAIKDAAEMFESPVASAISGIMGLTSTTLDSIEAMKNSGYGAAKGVEKVAKAVSNGIAILAIIQAAWQVINSIMSLFKGKDEEEYKKRIDGLKAQVDALDYAFNNLKEDMDEAWGTEAIDAYIKAVETLNDRQKAQLELIKQQSKAHIGHHSLEYYMKEEAGITNKELAEAKKWIAENGGDVTTGWITDWLYTLSAEKLKEFLTTGLGTTITGKLGGVSGTGDYSGDEWLNDLQAFADSAKTAEDIADEMAAKLNGISFDGLKDELKDLIMTFDTSFNDINNSFDEFMREAAYNKARTKYDEQLKKFYEDLKDLNNLYTEGEISEEEYKKRVAELRERYKALVKGAQDDYQQSLTDAGVNVKDIEQGATTGGFEAMSEDTGTELNGRFASMQAQETITAENTTKLLEYTLNLHDIADEIRDVQVNSYMELREINENTKKVVEPILDMQENIKKIKEQTESL